MSDEATEAAIKAVLEQLDGLAEHYVFYGVADGFNYYGVSDQQPTYVTAGLLSEAKVIERVKRDQTLAMSVHNALLPRAQADEDSPGASDGEES